MSLPGNSEKVIDAYGRLPLAFVPNAGQTDPRVRFSAQTVGAGFYFTKTGAVLALSSPGEARGIVLRLGFLGANRKTTIEGRGVGTGRVNYLIGNDPSRWHTDLPTYGRVVYRNLWPGIDMVFRGDASRLKYEFVLRPGARVENIRLAYRGAERLSLDSAGQLAIQTRLGTLKDLRPVSYQKVADRRVPVESRFLLRPEGRRRPPTASRSSTTTLGNRSSSTRASCTRRTSGEAVPISATPSPSTPAAAPTSPG
jgi:hypothetical protein